MIAKYLNKVLEGDQLSFDEAVELVNHPDKEALYEGANQIREKFTGNYLEMCTIANAKSGKCSEDCKFCSQSSHHQSKVEEYDLINHAEALELAKENASFGVDKFSLVTSGRTVSHRTLDNLSKTFKKIKQETNLEICASMGFIDKEKAEKLISFGVKNYHCNIETSRSHFKNICTTHTYDEKINTIKIAVEAGLKVCSGVIIGMGETMKQRVEMAVELRELGIKSIPINILNPIEGTPMSGMQKLTIPEILTTVAIFRFINPDANIRFAGGRNQLGDHENKALKAGINAALVGNYLTTVGTNIAQDIVNFTKEGFKLRPHEL